MQQSEIEQIRDEISKKIQNIESQLLLNQILTKLNQEEHIKQIEEIFNIKNIDYCLVNSFYQIISKMDIQQTHLSQFLNIIKTSGILSEEKIMTKSNLKDCYNDDVPNEIVHKLNPVLMELIAWKGKEGTKADVGDGERALKILTKTSLCESEDLELKGSQCRLNGTTHGFSATTVAREEYLKYLNTFLPDEKKLSIDSSDFDWNNLNFHNKGIEYYNSLALKKKDYISIFATGIALVYTECDKEFLEKELETCFCGDKINVSEFHNIFSKIQFCYYQQLKKFKGVLFINKDNLNIKYIKNGKEFYDAIVSKQIKIQNSWSWKQHRNFTHQFTLI